MTSVRLAAAVGLSLGLGLGLGCTVENPLYTPLPDSGIFGAADLAGRDSATTGGPDLAKPGDSCTARTCSSVGSASCENGVSTPDRKCPQLSDCVSGYCQPPPLSNDLPGRDCDILGPNENLCLADKNTTNSCQPFVSGATVVWRCTHAVGVGAVGTPCAHGGQCRSGFCGSNGTCFRACATQSDCPTSGTVKRICTEVEITVEGETLTVKSCVPL